MAVPTGYRMVHVHMYVDVGVPAIENRIYGCFVCFGFRNPTTIPFSCYLHPGGPDVYLVHRVDFQRS